MGRDDKFLLMMRGVPKHDFKLLGWILHRWMERQIRIKNNRIIIKMNPGTKSEMRTQKKHRKKRKRKRKKKEEKKKKGRIDSVISKTRAPTGSCECAP